MQKTANLFTFTKQIVTKKQEVNIQGPHKDLTVLSTKLQKYIYPMVFQYLKLIHLNCIFQDVNYLPDRAIMKHFDFVT